MPAARKVKMSSSEKIKANRTTSNKIFGEYIQQFIHKKCVTKKVLRVSGAIQWQRNVQKSVWHVQMFLANYIY